jgi:hypothetical protein
MIIDGERKFDQNVNQCVIMLVKNMITSTIDYLFFLTQPHTIFSKIVDEGVKPQLLQLYTPN